VYGAYEWWRFGACAGLAQCIAYRGRESMEALSYNITCCGTLPVYSQRRSIQARPSGAFARTVPKLVPMCCAVPMCCCCRRSPVAPCCAHSPSCSHPAPTVVEPSYLTGAQLAQSLHCSPTTRPMHHSPRPLNEHNSAAHCPCSVPCHAVLVCCAASLRGGLVMSLMCCRGMACRLVIHLRSCRPGNTAKPVGTPAGPGGSGAPQHPAIVARSGGGGGTLSVGYPHSATAKAAASTLPSVANSFPARRPLTSGGSGPSMGSPLKSKRAAAATAVGRPSPSPPTGTKSARSSARPNSRPVQAAPTAAMTRGGGAGAMSLEELGLSAGAERGDVVAVAVAKVQTLEQNIQAMQGEVAQLKELLRHLASTP